MIRAIQDPTLGTVGLLSSSLTLPRESSGKWFPTWVQAELIAPKAQTQLFAPGQTFKTSDVTKVFMFSLSHIACLLELFSSFKDNWEERGAKEKMWFSWQPKGCSLAGAFLTDLSSVPEMLYQRFSPLCPLQSIKKVPFLSLFESRVQQKFRICWKKH